MCLILVPLREQRLLFRCIFSAANFHDEFWESDYLLRWFWESNYFVTMVLRIRLFCYDGSENQTILLRWFWESDYFAALPSAPPALSWSGRKWPQCLSMDKLLFWLAAPLHPHPPPPIPSYSEVHSWYKIERERGGIMNGGGGGLSRVQSKN